MVLTYTDYILNIYLLRDKANEDLEKSAFAFCLEQSLSSAPNENCSNNRHNEYIKIYIFSAILSAFGMGVMSRVISAITFTIVI